MHEPKISAKPDPENEEQKIRDSLRLNLDRDKTTEIIPHLTKDWVRLQLLPFGMN
jgi:hypothetical protein